MSRFFDDEDSIDIGAIQSHLDRGGEPHCPLDTASKNGGISNEAYLNDYRNRMPFHYVEDGVDGYYYWQYGATMTIEIILDDLSVAITDDTPPYVVRVRKNGVDITNPETMIADIVLGSMADKSTNEYYNKAEVDVKIASLWSSLNAKTAAIANQLVNVNNGIAAARSEMAAIRESLDRLEPSSASFRGSWQTYASIPTNVQLYPENNLGERTPLVNDYLVVTRDETNDNTSWRYRYTGEWHTDGKDGWQAEYQINEAPLTEEQLGAINSGVTQEKLASVQNELAELLLALDEAVSLFTKQGLITDYPGLGWDDIVVAPAGLDSPYFTGALLTGITNFQVLAGNPDSIIVTATINGTESDYTLNRLPEEDGIYPYANTGGMYGIMVVNSSTLTVIETEFSGNPATTYEHVASSTASVMVLSLGGSPIQSFILNSVSLPE